jgi:hypothetical protein
VEQLMPVKLCISAGCPNPVRDARSKGRCDKHYRKMERQRSARRREATMGVYGKKFWAMRRKQAFERDPSAPG